MSKKYKGKVCVYCGHEVSTTADHVIAREFFPAAVRSGLPKAPACSTCNSRKSAIEQYLMTVFPFASDHEVAKEVMTTRVSDRLEGNKRLHRELKFLSKTVWTPDETGLYVPTMSLPFDPLQAAEYFAMVAQGLLWVHFRQILDADHTATSMALTEHGVNMFHEKFWPSGGTLAVKKLLSAGALKYIGRRSRENPKMSAWLIQIYGGIGMRSVGRTTGANASMFGALTGRNRVFENARLLSKFAI